MNKQEFAVVVLLSALLLGWYIFKPKQEVQPPTPGVAATNVVASADSVTNAVLSADNGSSQEKVVDVKAVDAMMAEDKPVEESSCILSNDLINISFSSLGASIKNVSLNEYKEFDTDDSGPVHLAFTNSPALAITGVPGFGDNNNFDLKCDKATSTVVMTKTAGGLQFKRTIIATNGYEILVSDSFKNISETAVALPTNSIQTGEMSSVDSSSKGGRLGVTLGLDSLNKVGKKKAINFWCNQGIIKKSPVNKQFKKLKDADGVMPESVSAYAEEPTYWGAAKNKFFVQIINPKDVLADSMELNASRDMSNKKVMIDQVFGRLEFSETLLQPGQELTRDYGYYVGPKKYSVLKKLGEEQADVMQFASWKWFKAICIALLYVLEFIHSIIPNYGVAIILLTVLVRMLFWPITHKSTESMKKMQAIQPEIKALQAKYKNKPQELQRAQMELYRDKGVNPFSSCLPMLIQLPVFFALFRVLRSAVELRYADFLWITNLSEPESILAGVLPIPLRILPLLMTAVSLGYNKLMPSSGDAQQKQMMMFMPIMMLFIFYGMPSGLVLYWTVSQLIAVVQMLVQRKGGFKALFAKS